MTVPPAAEAAAAFPRQVRLGAATAAYQIEGAVREDGRGESIWDRFCTTPGAIDRGETGAIACDHYHRWREDVELMAALNLESYRFSIAWPRVQPDGTGPLNPAGLEFYRRLAGTLRERGIEPVATLYHWDLPQALQDRGGWAARDTVERFADYAELMAERLGGEIGTWITHNEPWVVAFLGHAEGVKAPGVRDWPTALAVSHHLLLSHGLAAQRLRAVRPDSEVAITVNLAPMRPASGAPEDVAAAARADGHQNRWFLDPVLRGAYPQDMLEHYEQRFGPLDAIRDGDTATLAQPLDFLGVNYYFPMRVAADPAGGPLGFRAAEKPGPRTEMGWPIDAGGLHELLVRLHRDYGPLELRITENGSAFADPPPAGGVIEDPDRLAYLHAHLAAVARAVADGADVRGYAVWSLLDNFEWEQGYAKRFGIVGVDYPTQERIPKRSGLWYRDFIASRVTARPEPVSPRNR
jgi:beta-glucosidase